MEYSVWKREYGASIISSIHLHLLQSLNCPKLAYYSCLKAALKIGTGTQAVFSLVSKRGVLTPGVYRSCMMANSPPNRSILFQLLQSTLDDAKADLSPRCGNLTLPKRDPMPTPNYIAITSRGAVPHLSQDMMRDQTSIDGVYAALEDCKLGPFISGSHIFPG